MVKARLPLTAHLMKETVDEPEGVTRLLLVNQLLIRKEMAAGSRAVVNQYLLPAH